MAKVHRFTLGAEFYVAQLADSVGRVHKLLVLIAGNTDRFGTEEWMISVCAAETVLTVVNALRASAVAN